jgi:hypothetical protein
VPSFDVTGEKDGTLALSTVGSSKVSGKSLIPSSR